MLRSLSESAQKELANLITLLLGITVAAKMQASMFLTKETLMILLLGLIAFIFDTVGGVLFAKLMNLFTKKKVNPMIGAAGISAFPMVRTRHSQNGTSRGPGKPFAHARGRRECRRTDCVGHCRRTHHYVGRGGVIRCSI